MVALLSVEAGKDAEGNRECEATSLYLPCCPSGVLCGSVAERERERRRRRGERRWRGAGAGVRGEMEAE
jgi:hypothetical protein